MSLLAKQNIECKIAKVLSKAFMTHSIFSIVPSSVLSDLICRESAADATRSLQTAASCAAMTHEPLLTDTKHAPAGPKAPPGTFLNLANRQKISAKMFRTVLDIGRSRASWIQTKSTRRWQNSGATNTSAHPSTSPWRRQRRHTKTWKISCQSRSKNHVWVFFHPDEAALPKKNNTCKWSIRHVCQCYNVDGKTSRTSISS